jgi:DNA-binding Lrp family transcriptional regulator
MVKLGSLASMSPSPQLLKLRLISRISVGFLLDLARIGRMERDLADALILLTIVQANVAPLARDADLSMTYATYDELPPDDLRRRISVSAIAQSLRLPYETVRRRVAAAAARGACVVTPQGVYVPGETLNTSQHREMVLRTYELVREVYGRLSGLHALEGLPPPEPRSQLTSQKEPVRAVVRASADYMLRVVDLITVWAGDLQRGLILLTILRCNLEDLPDDPTNQAATPSGFAPDEIRKPVRVSTISERLRLPEETVRRHAARLVDQRLCAREREGLVVPAHVVARPEVLQMMSDNQANVRRMFEGLARLGITAEWDRASSG